MERSTDRSEAESTKSSKLKRWRTIKLKYSNMELISQKKIEEEFSMKTWEKLARLVNIFIYFFNLK